MQVENNQIYFLSNQPKKLTLSLKIPACIHVYSGSHNSTLSH
jgi:hypothetical protein